MSKISRKIALWAVSLLFTLCVGLLGINFSRQLARAEGSIGDTFTVNMFNGAVPFEYVDGATEGLPTGYTDDVMKITTTSGVAYVTLNFSASQIKASAVDSIIVKIYSPQYTTADEFRTVGADGATLCQYGAGANDMSAWCEVAVGAQSIASATDANGYLSSLTVGVRVKGGATVYYIDEITVKMKEAVATTPVTFTSLNPTWNDNTTILNNGFHYTVIHLSGLQTSGYLGEGDDWRDMMANSTINGGASYFNFSPASYFAGPNVASDFIILFTAQAPAQGDEFIVKAGATFDVGGDDNRLYELTNDICLKFNGTAWEVFTPAITPEPSGNVVVNFTGISSPWNSYFFDNKYCSVLGFDGGIPGGDLLGDYSDLLAKMTINGEAVDTNNVSFICPLWLGLEGGLVIRFVNNPAVNSVMTLPAGATFTVGSDSKVFEIASDIYLKFDGSVWSVTDAPVGPDEPNVPDVPAEIVDVTYSSVHSEWNNFDYVDQGYFCTFIIFNGGIGGGSLDGDFSDLLSKMTLNGQPVDTENVSLICAAWIGANSGFILRFKTLPAEKSVLVLPEGATFTVGGGDTNVYKITESVELKLLNGKWSVPAPMAAFIGVNVWNNNIFSLAGTRYTLLDFNVPNLGNVVNGNKNLVAMAGVSINGVKLTDIEGASINYANGENHMAIDLPATAIYPTEEYPITILKVEEGTMFENYSLPEITLSLIGGTWVVGELETMPKVDNHVTVSDIMGVDRYEMGAEGSISAATGFEGDVHFKVVYRTEEAIVNYEPRGGLTVYLNSTNLWDGWRIFFVANKVYVYDATMGGVGDEHVLIGEADFGIANGIEMQLEISVTQTNGKYSIVIGGSCAKILEINDITPIGNCIGGGIMFYSSARGCNVKDYKYGDIFDPVLTIYSKQEIVLNEGDAVPEIFAEAKDGFTAITPTYTWDEGAITDGKMNAGIWQCEVVATDANGNYTMQIIRVIVKGEREYRVTFDGKDEAVYAYGEKIEKPADPTKASTEKYAYTFDGWYFGEDKWDFEHDIVTSDVALVAKFIQSDVLYKVTFTIAGEETQVLYVTFGAQVDLAIFDKEGLDKEVKQDGKAIEMLIVTADTTIEISYHEKNNTQKIGCFGGLIGGGSVLALLGAAGGLVIRKRREDDEE